jgi:DNA-binding HxlR family transcriptional regulator
LASGGTVSELVTFCTVGLCCTRCDRPVLTRSLRALERDGIVVRRYFPEVPPCVEYRLTDLGFTLCEPVGHNRSVGREVR